MTDKLIEIVPVVTGSTEEVSSVPSGKVSSTGVITVPEQVVDHPSKQSTPDAFERLSR